MEKKFVISQEIIRVIQESSVDCRLNKNANIYKKENKINCM